MPERSTRRLAAILFTDIVGYTAMMQQDEALAVTAVNRHQEVLEKQVAPYQGEVLQYYGDGSLSIFNSASEAVRCAMEIQLELQVEPQVPLRIGIHIGEILFENGKVFGDGVNIASRIESMGVAGAVLFSREVYSKIRNRMEFQLVSLGAFEFKNVEEPVAVFAIANEGFVVPVRHELEGKFKTKENQGPIQVKRPFLFWGMGVGLAFLLLLLGGILGTKFSTTPEKVKLERFHINLPADAPMAFAGAAPLGAGQTSLAISPDGNQVVYVAQTNKQTQLYVRSLEDFEAQPIKGTEGAYHPFFSPDGQWVGFFAASQLKKVSIVDGSPETLGAVNHPLGAVWTSEDRIIYANQEGATLFQISAFGGIAKKIEVQGVTGNVQHFMDPSLLPGEKHLLVNANWPRVIKVISLEDGKQQVILKGGGSATYMKPGHVAYANQGKLRVVPFDAKRLLVTGNPITLIEDIRTESWNMGQFGISKEGTLVYAQGIPVEMGQLIFRDLAGREEDLPIKAGFWGTFKMGHKKDIIAISNMDTWAIHVYDLNTGVATEIKSETPYYNAVLTQDDEQVFFTNTDEQQEIFMSDVKGITAPKKLFPDSHGNKRWPMAISPDGNVLQYCEANPDTKSDIKFHFLDKREKDQVLYPNNGDEQLGSFSPSGKYFAYYSNESGNPEIYVQPFPMTGERWKVSMDGGTDPIWSPTEDKLYYSKGFSILEVPVQYTNGISFDTPKVLFSRPLIDVPGKSIDITPDGKRFVLIKPLSEKTTASQLKVIKNWFEEVKQYAPAK